MNEGVRTNIPPYPEMVRADSGDRPESSLMVLCFQSAPLIEATDCYPAATAKSITDYPLERKVSHENPKLATAAFHRPNPPQQA